jgi:hypothetical protein
MDRNQLNARLKDAFPAGEMKTGWSQRISAGAQARLLARPGRDGRRIRRAAVLMAAAALAGGPWVFTSRIEAARILYRSAQAELCLEAVQTISRPKGEDASVVFQQSNLIATKRLGGGRILMVDQGTIWFDHALRVEVFKPRAEPKFVPTPLGMASPIDAIPPSKRWRSRGSTPWIAALLSSTAEVKKSPIGTRQVILGTGAETVKMTFRSDTGLISSLESEMTSVSKSPMARMSIQAVKKEFLGYPEGARQILFSEWCSLVAKRLPVEPLTARQQGGMAAAILGAWPVDENLAVKLAAYRGEPEGERGFKDLQKEMRAEAAAVRPLLRGIAKAAGWRHLEVVFVPLSAARHEFGRLEKPLFSLRGWLGLSIGSSPWNWIHEEIPLKGALAELKLKPPAQAIPGLQELLSRQSMKRHGSIRKEARSLLRSLEAEQD